jgi:hypothetical protein
MLRCSYESNKRRNASLQGSSEPKKQKADASSGRHQNGRSGLSVLDSNIEIREAREIRSSRRSPSAGSENDFVRTISNSKRSVKVKESIRFQAKGGHDSTPIKNFNINEGEEQKMAFDDDEYDYADNDNMDVFDGQPEAKKSTKGGNQRIERELRQPSLSPLFDPAELTSQYEERPDSSEEEGEQVVDRLREMLFSPDDYEFDSDSDLFERQEQNNFSIAPTNALVEPNTLITTNNNELNVSVAVMSVVNIYLHTMNGMQIYAGKQAGRQQAVNEVYDPVYLPVYDMSIFVTVIHSY